MLEEVIEYMDRSLKSGVYKGTTTHFERTLYWLKQLKPDADEAMQIAAYAHDISRLFRRATTAELFKDIESNDPTYLKEHQAECAKIICEFLRKNDYDSKATDRVHNMVLNHEIGGDPESDLIKDADSISYFEVNAMRFVEIVAKDLGKQKIKNKLDWMYERISSSKARQIAKPMYDKALKALDATK